MTAAGATLNLLMGLIYLGIGALVLYDLARNWPTLGFSHFGAAFAALAFTCGPHHFAHGIHIGFEGSPVTQLDLITVAAGLPAGAIWAGLRVEVFIGGRGDRFVGGTPGWLMAVPTATGIYVTAIVAGAIGAGAAVLSPSAGVIASFMLALIYAAIGYFLVRTQIANRRPLGGWSLSGLALAAIFGTCAVMHGAYGFYELNGTYPADTHMLLIDAVSVPAGMYFLWVVHALYRGSFRDWNGAPGARRSEARTPPYSGGKTAPTLDAPALDASSSAAR